MHVAFRNYETTPIDSVSETYRNNHEHQTVQFVKQQQQTYTPCRHRTLSM